MDHMVLTSSEKLQYDEYLRSEAIKLLDAYKEIPIQDRANQSITIFIKDIDEEYLKTTNASPILPRYVDAMTSFGITDNMESLEEIWQVKFFEGVRCFALNDKENGCITFFTNRGVSDFYLDYALGMLESWGKRGEES